MFLRETKNSLIGVNSVVFSIVDTKVDIDISIAHVNKLIARYAAMNWMPSCLSISYLRHLLEEAGKFLSVKDLAIINTQFHSLDKAGFLCPIVMPTLQSLLRGLR